MDDLLIIGGSAAGAAAGIYAARRNLKARLLAGDLGGEVAQSGEVENWPGTVHTTGVELAATFEQHLRSYPLPIEVGVWVEKVDRAGRLFTVSVKQSDGQPATYRAKALIIATGVHPRLLGIPGEAELKNKGLSYCTVCDGPLYRNKRVVTIGGGNSALESAIMLAGLAQEVTVINKNSAMKGEAVLRDKLQAAHNVTFVADAQTTKILGGQFVTGIEYTVAGSKTPITQAADGVFVHIGMVPNSSFIDIVEKNQFGEIKVTATCETTIPGLFAAGDVTDHPFKQIAIAAGQGVTASLMATRYLDNLRN